MLTMRSLNCTNHEREMQFFCNTLQDFKLQDINSRLCCLLSIVTGSIFRDPAKFFWIDVIVPELVEFRSCKQ